jgi:hypothetical protein
VQDWEVLFRRAAAAMDSLHHLPRVEWTFGGGTAMQLFYDHRNSKDIDIFMNDVQILMSLSPRVNDSVEDLGWSSYTEQSNFIKMHFAEGEVDFIVAPRLLPDVAPKSMPVLGREVLVDTPAEIVAKKCFYRAAEFTPRDVFDFAVLIEGEPGVIRSHADVFFAHKDLLEARVSRMLSDPTQFVAQMDALEISPQYVDLKNRALDVVSEFAADAENMLRSRRRRADGMQH